MIFNRDDRVYYISGRYGSSRSNPLKGGDYSCKGTIFSKDIHTLSVRWDNGTDNTYGQSDLEHASSLKSTDPNALWTMRRKK